MDKIKSQNNLGMDNSEPDIPVSSSLTEPMVEQKPEEPERKSLPQDYVKADTIEISREATENILKSVEKQPSKYWHFQFKNTKDKEDFTAALEHAGYDLTVVYNEKQNTPDITLLLKEQPVGKIHLLLCDRRDTNNKSKYYCKIHFYHFTDPNIYSAVKAAVVNYFEGFKSSNAQSNAQSNPQPNSPMTAGKRKRRTMKKKRAMKKKTHRRK